MPRVSAGIAEGLDQGEKPLQSVLEENIAFPKSVVRIDEQGQAPHGRTGDSRTFCLGTLTSRFLLRPGSDVCWGHPLPKGALILRPFSKSIVLRFAENEDAMVTGMSEEIRNVQYVPPRRASALAPPPE